MERLPKETFRDTARYSVQAQTHREYIERRDPKYLSPAAIKSDSLNGT